MSAFGNPHLDRALEWRHEEQLSFFWIFFYFLIRYILAMQQFQKQTYKLSVVYQGFIGKKHGFWYTIPDYNELHN